MKNYKVKLIFLFFICIVFTLVSCTSEKATESKMESRTENLDRFREIVKERNTYSRDTVHLILMCDDTIEFDQSEISVNEGQYVILMFGHLEEKVNSKVRHNFVLLSQGVIIEDFKIKAANAEKTEYVPANSENVIISTGLMGGGSSEFISFDAPPKGTYDYICSVPWHPHGAMVGKFIVK
ncbi:MAG: plastocyanin/azurin family copper-binding protein [Crocinitomicaceae bacterium]|nr:plastocyanin/azurin family copper-binding protein [Crocinitomicaceae bacterium]